MYQSTQKGLLYKTYHSLGVLDWIITDLGPNHLMRSCWQWRCYKSTLHTIRVNLVEDAAHLFVCMSAKSGQFPSKSCAVNNKLQFFASDFLVTDSSVCEKVLWPKSTRLVAAVAAKTAWWRQWLWRCWTMEVDEMARAVARQWGRAHPPPSVAGAATTTMAGEGGRWRARDESRRDNNGRWGDADGQGTRASATTTAGEGTLTSKGRELGG